VDFSFRKSHRENRIPQNSEQERRLRTIKKIKPVKIEAFSGGIWAIEALQEKEEA
jgi:hypothetical protein